jgi:hypothetical protein
VKHAIFLVLGAGLIVFGALTCANVSGLATRLARFGRRANESEPAILARGLTTEGPVRVWGLIPLALGVIIFVVTLAHSV